MTRKGDWFQTYTGKKFYPFDPRAEDVDIADIARSLSLQCRFNGHTTQFYSVAQHSIHVAHVFGKLAKGTSFSSSNQAHLCALLHDATEAYVGDLIRPIKINMPQYQDMEEEVWHCILEAFDLLEIWEHFPIKPLVKKADNILLMTERRDILPEGPAGDKNKWFGDEMGIEPDPDLTVVPCSSYTAEHGFRNLFDSLKVFNTPQWVQEEKENAR
jgi:5'-deoxynucleotidase YfbR-like HD superfamily hydrolase